MSVLHMACNSQPPLRLTGWGIGIDVTRIRKVYIYSLNDISYSKMHLLNVPSLLLVYLKLNFDFSARSLVLMLMVCCISGDSKGDG